jgi:hypothetical protein
VRLAASADVGAVVLSLGEPTTARALRSLRAQTLPAGEPVLVEGITPFHRALNDGVARTTAPFFVQVDADMVLDADAVATLLDAMEPDVGIAVGALRDPLMGTIAGLKLYRRECFEHARLRDTPAPEVDFYLRLRERGWHTVCVSGRTVGEHRPDYEAGYVFGTYVLLGSRYLPRADACGLRWRVEALRRSDHAMAPVARIAMSHGVFVRPTRDVAKPRPSASDSRFLRELAVAPDATVPDRSVARLLGLAPEQLFDGFRDLGASLRASSAARLRGCLRLLAEVGDGSSIVAEIALGHGALAGPPAR